ncbi:uncharacterized protein [Ptychodera flava]|uniref:uncharacterized protein n=1 Tax=Ptychodera flava TaxID=63121 RepID=UPI00396A12A7
MSQFARDFVKFTSFTEGRDKIYRTVQYLSRWILWYSEKRGATPSIKVKNIESAISLSRKLFRMARTLDFLQKAADAMYMTDDVLKTFEIAGMLGKAIWLVTDHVIWFAKVKVIEVDLKFWSKISAWTWFLGIFSLLMRDLRKLQMISERAKTVKDRQDKEARKALRKEYHAARLELIKNFCDFWIPLGILEYSSKGWGATGGVVSSLIGWKQQWQKTVRK